MKSIEHQIQDMLYQFVLTIIPSEFAGKTELDETTKKLCDQILQSKHTREHAKRSLALSLDMQIQEAKVFDQCLDEVPVDFLDKSFGEEACDKYNEWYSKWSNRYLHLCKLRTALDLLP